MMTTLLPLCPIIRVAERTKNRTISMSANLDDMTIAFSSCVLVAS